MGIIKRLNDDNNGDAEKILTEMNAVVFKGDGSSMQTGLFGSFEEIVEAAPPEFKELLKNEAIYNRTKQIFDAAKEYNKEE